MSDIIFETLHGPLTNVLETNFTNLFRKGYVRASGVIIPEYYTKFATSIQKMEVRNDDTWVISFPKTGERVFNVMCSASWNNVVSSRRFIGNASATDCKTILFHCFSSWIHSHMHNHTPLFDLEDFLCAHPEITFPPYVTDSVRFVNQMQSPRYIKTHFPWQLLPTELQEKKAKIVYVSRNPKDACVSYYHHCRLMEGYRGTFHDFCELFLNDMLCFAPFWSHVLSFWERRNEPNILFLKYEDMKQDLSSVIQKTSKFLGKDLSSTQIATLADHLSFSSMRSNPAVNYENVIEVNRKYKLIHEEEIAIGSFMRQGQVGDWKAKMPPEMVTRFDEWTEKHLTGTGLTFI